MFLVDKQAREAKELAKQLKGTEKLKHFWYYYKFHVLALIFLVALISCSLTECANKIKYDLSISCYSSTNIDSTNLSLLTDELEKKANDINENGKVDVGVFVNIANLSIPSEQSQTIQMKISAEVAAGDSFGYILDEEYYKMFSDIYAGSVESVVPISDIPIIKETFDLKEGQKLYWATKTLYEPEKGKPEKVKAHENAVKIQNYLSSLIK